MSFLDTLGDPDLDMGPVKVWVHGYQFPDASDEWDGNWLRITASATGHGSSVRLSGAYLETLSFARFLDDLPALARSLEHVATLDSLEPNLLIEVSTIDRVGHLRVRTTITGEHLTESHHFDHEADQSYIPHWTAACKRVLDRFPVRKDRGA